MGVYCDSCTLAACAFLRGTALQLNWKETVGAGCGAYYTPSSQRPDRTPANHPPRADEGRRQKAQGVFQPEVQKGRLGPSWKAGAVTSAARWERTSVFVPLLLRWRTLRSLRTVRADSRCQPRPRRAARSRRGSKARGPRRHPTAPKGPSNLGRSRPPPGQGGATPPGLQALSRSVPLTGGQLGRQRSLTCHFPDACRAAPTSP